MSVIRDLYDRLERADPGIWKYYEDNYVEDEYLSTPIGPSQALEIEVSNIKPLTESREYILVFRSWDATLALSDEIPIMSIPTDLIDTAACAFAWYLADRICVSEYGEVSL